MPLESKAQGRFLNWKFGHPWTVKHHFGGSQKGLPQYVKAAAGDSNVGLHILRQHIAILPKTPPKAPADGQHPKITYPKDHLMGMRVPLGGSSCAKCEYVSGDMKSCGNPLFVKWNNGDATLPDPANEYCCDMYGLRKASRA